MTRRMIGVALAVLVSVVSGIGLWASQADTPTPPPVPAVTPAPESRIEIPLYWVSNAAAQIDAAIQQALMTPPSPPPPKPTPPPAWLKRTPYGTHYPSYVHTLADASRWVQRVWLNYHWGSITLARAQQIVLGKAPARPVLPAPKPVYLLIWPLYGRLTSYFSAAHRAIDIAANLGTPVRAACTGRVVWAGWKTNGGGRVVDIACSNGLLVSNNHLSAIYVRAGTVVAVGTRVGAEGSSGNTTGPHLHFAVFLRGVAVNPLRYLPR